jgi:hypothetical protein
MHLDVLLKLRQVVNNILWLVVQSTHADVLPKAEIDRNQHLATAREARATAREARAMAHANESVQNREESLS